MNKFSTSKNLEVQNSVDEEIDLRALFFKYWGYWRWILLSVLLFASIGFFVCMCIGRRFDVKTAVLLKEDKGSSGSVSRNSPLGGLQELGLFGATNNIDNEIAVFSSPNLMQQVATSLELQTSYFEKGFFRDTEVYTKCPFYVRLNDIRPEDLNGYIVLTIENNKNKGVDIEGKYTNTNKNEETDFSYILEELPGFIELPNELGKLYVSYRKDVDLTDEAYIITIDNVRKVAYDMVENIQVSTTTKNSSVLNINVNVGNVEKGVDVLNKIAEIYNKNNVEENNETARNTSHFINARLIDIAKELEGVEDKAVSYQEKQGITGISSEAQLLVEKTSNIEEKRLEIMTQMKVLELVDELIKDKDDYKLVSTLGIADPGLVAIITEYNTLLISYERLYRSTSESSPSRIRAVAQIENIRQNIQNSLTDIRTSLNISKNELERQIATISSKIYSVPSQQRGLLEITRQQQVKQALYIYLMQVQEETNIALASTFDKAKVITDPIIPEGPISPRRSIILLAFCIIGLGIPIAIIYILDRLKVNISDREELERLSNVSVIGELMKMKEITKAVVVEPNLTTPIVELFRALRNNVKFILDSPDKKIILVTSTVPGEGKTFVSVNLAASFALSDKKILLVGADIRNPRLAADMNFKKGLGLTSYLLGQEADWRSLLISLEGFPNLSILQAGIVPPNPNELLMKPAMKDLLEQAKEIYDVIIIDSAPVGVISDTFLFAPFADVTIYVARENVTPKDAITFINTLQNDKKLPNMYLALNGVDTLKNKGSYGRYGYGKTYGYGNRE